eukprot:1178718-Prorocentrum_minimum.AAC.1
MSLYLERITSSLNAPLNPPYILVTAHLEDAPGILHYLSGSEAYGRLNLIDKSPLDLLWTSSGPPMDPLWTFSPRRRGPYPAHRRALSLSLSLSRII